MKRVLLSLVLLGFCSVSLAQRVQHHSYTTYYNQALGGPDSVVWNLTPNMLACGQVTRHDKFAQDPALPNSTKGDAYKHSGFQRGHLFNFEESSCNETDRIECFYMSNMLPQYGSFNTGDWKRVEIQEQAWAKTTPLHIIAGGIGTLGTLASGVNIPRYMWKAICMNGQWSCWIMPNAKTSKGHTLKKWKIPTLEEFNKKTGLHLHN
ncbi:DNA/RNA non-specific endonuclease [Mucilaginibacter sp. AK015]|uniref:DNA/RNA non-specific endonuclease n=1 Tax=Mucilaginibacter sp. AK015 TaxID=2723072 RepID=UPI001615B55D|nr:DNA/RNA non-specific endonuclease [Mucilaginibacter sp. AK015]MBB5397177.1 endonuclease G [Mucilaginibacter sp. AK015]